MTPGSERRTKVDRRTGIARRRSDRDYRRDLRRIIILVLLAYFLLVGLGILLYWNAKQSADAKAKAAVAVATALTERTAREAEKRAGVQATYQACVRSIPTLINVNRFVNATKGGFQDLLTNAEANHAATPSDNPQYRAQVANIRRLKERVAATGAVKFPIPTRKACLDRRTEDLKLLSEQSAREEAQT